MYNNNGINFTVYRYDFKEALARLNLQQRDFLFRDEAEQFMDFVILGTWEESQMAGNVQPEGLNQQVFSLLENREEGDDEAHKNHEILIIKTA